MVDNTVKVEPNVGPVLCTLTPQPNIRCPSGWTVEQNKESSNNVRLLQIAMVQ